MSGVRRRGTLLRRRAAVPASDREQDTTRISASQLAEVLARVDGKNPVEPETGSRQPHGAQARSVSGERPIVKPRATPPATDTATAEPAIFDPVAGHSGVVDFPEGQPAAVERSVCDDHVLNVTSPTTPDPSGQVLVPPATSARNESDTTGAAEDADAAPTALVVNAGGRTRAIVLLLILSAAALVSAAVLVLVRQR